MKTVDIFLTELKSQLRPEQIATDDESLSYFAQDWSRVLTPDASAILFPESTQQVSFILKTASKHAISIIPSGGRTGLSGGAVATNKEVILSLTKLNFLHPVNPRSLTVRVGAGAITQAVHEHCSPLDLTWPVDFASKGSSTVGGNIATNAGGVRVLKYGNTRNWVLGLTAVTSTGEVLEFNGELEKNNTGYDFRQLMIGSEGTLAVITEATLKLSPLPDKTQVFFFSLSDFKAVLELFAFARKHFSNLSAFECLDRKSMDSVLKHSKLKAPVSEMGGAFVLLELELSSDRSGNAANTDHEALLEEILESGMVLDAVMAQSEREAKELWHYREGVAESILSGHDVHQEDVSVPVSRLEDFYAEITSRYASALPDFAVFFFGHIGDGNLHIFIQKPNGMERTAFMKKCHEADLMLFQTLKQFHGSVSAEHGVGLLKKHALPFTRSRADIELMKATKLAFDPAGILNPGKIFG